jgi:hypothetical protein
VGRQGAAFAFSIAVLLRASRVTGHTRDRKLPRVHRAAHRHRAADSIRAKFRGQTKEGRRVVLARTYRSISGGERLFSWRARSLRQQCGDANHPPGVALGAERRCCRRHFFLNWRQGRSCADAIGQCFCAVAKSYAPVWVLEGYIKSCFDRISPLSRCSRTRFRTPFSSRATHRVFWVTPLCCVAYLSLRKGWKEGHCGSRTNSRCS